MRMCRVQRGVQWLPVRGTGQRRAAAAHRDSAAEHVSHSFAQRNPQQQSKHFDGANYAVRIMFSHLPLTVMTVGRVVG